MKKKYKYDPEQQEQKYESVNCKINGNISFSECSECFFSNRWDVRKLFSSRVMCQKENRIRE